MSFHVTDLTSSHIQSTRKLPPVPPIDKAILRGYGKKTHIDDFVIAVLYLVSDALILLVAILDDIICFRKVQLCELQTNLAIIIYCTRNQSVKIQLLYYITSGEGNKK